MKEDLIGLVMLLLLGIGVTYYQSKWFKYDPDNDF